MNDERSIGDDKFFRNLIDAVQSYAQIFQQSIFEVVDESVNSELSFFFPGLLDDWDPCYVVYLLFHVQFTQKVLVCFLGFMD